MSPMNLEHYNWSPKCLGDQRMVPRFLWFFYDFLENKLGSYFLLLSCLNIGLHFLTHNLSQHLLLFSLLENIIYKESA